MNRREFLSVSAVAASGAGVAVAAGRAAEKRDAKGRQAGAPRRALMKLGCQRYGSDTQSDVQYYQRHGVQAVHRGVAGMTTAQLVELRERLASQGFDTIGRMHIDLRLVLKAGPERQQHIEKVCQTIRRAGQARISPLLYALYVVHGLRTESATGRGGVTYSTWELAKAETEPPLVKEPISAEDMWEGITWILERVVPVAEKAKVRLACHPHDPPLPPGFRNVNRVLGTVEGLKRFVRIAESDYHGLNFCQGTVAEMLEDPGEEIYEVIRWFGQRKKIFNVHFRNLRGRRGNWQEVYPDEGDVDMLRAMRIYKELGYDGAIMPDHLPNHPDDPQQRQGFAFAYGYIRALIQAVNAEG